MPEVPRETPAILPAATKAAAVRAKAIAALQENLHACRTIDPAVLAEGVARLAAVHAALQAIAAFPTDTLAAVLEDDTHG
jgi:hypothetical protein